MYWLGPFKKCEDKLVTKEDFVYKKFNYLMYTEITGKGSQTKENAGHADNANLKFVQSHDLNTGSTKLYANCRTRYFIYKWI